MQFSTFSEYLQKLESQASRLEMTETLSQLFNGLETTEIKKACYILQGTLVPAYESAEFQLSSKMVIRALAQIMPNNDEKKDNLFGENNSNETVKKIEQLYKKSGDVGETAFVIAQQLKKSTHELTVLEVYEILTEIAFESGQGSQQRKLESLASLIKKVDALSTKFIVRVIIGKLRLGFSSMTMIDALSWAITEGKEHRTLLEDAYQKKADIGSLAEYYLGHIKKTDTIEEVQSKLEKEYSVTIGIPVIPALCQRLNTSAEIIEKMKHVYVEPKYDGLRVQIHYSRSDRSLGSLEQGDQETKGPIVKVFSRSLDVMTDMFPEVLEIGMYLNCDSAIFDGEAIGYDPATGKLLPFQQTMNRKRKHDIEETAKTIPLKFFLYDILAVNNKELIGEPLVERKKILESVLKKNEIFVSTPYIITDQADEVKEFHQKQLALGLEGAVIKQVQSPYQSGRKGWSWVKIKEAEGSSGKLSDTIDGVIMGYYVGKGARTQFGLGAILVGIYDEKTEQFLTITKVGTGMTETQLTEIKNLLREHETDTQPKNYQVHKNLIPDVWVKPSIVIEIAADELTKSPTHTAGVAMRFPRLVKIRSDKKAKDATTLKELDSIQIA